MTLQLCTTFWDFRFRRRYEQVPRSHSSCHCLDVCMSEFSLTFRATHDPTRCHCYNPSLTGLVEIGSLCVEALISSWVIWQKIMYSAGFSLFSSMMRKLAVSRSVAGSTHTGTPSESFLKMSYGDGIASVTLTDTADAANQAHTCIILSADLSKWLARSVFTKPHQFIHDVYAPQESVRGCEGARGRVSDRNGLEGR